MGRGESNIAHKSPPIYNGKSLVLKIPQFNEPFSQPARGARKWQIMNPDAPAAVALDGPSLDYDVNFRTPEEQDPHNIFLWVENDSLMGRFKPQHGEILIKNLNDLPNAKEIQNSILEEDIALALAHEHEVRQTFGVGMCGLLAPFIQGRTELTEDETALALLDLYKRTRHIILDYGSDGNIIFEELTGKMRYVDFDEAISCDSPISRSQVTNTSDPYYDFQQRYYRYNDQQLGTYVNLILLYIEHHLASYLCPMANLNDYLTLNTLRALENFERLGIPLTKTMLMTIACLHNHYQQPIYLDPQCIIALDASFKDWRVIKNICDELNTLAKVASPDMYSVFTHPRHIIPIIDDMRTLRSQTISSYIFEFLNASSQTIVAMDVNVEENEDEQTALGFKF